MKTCGIGTVLRGMVATVAMLWTLAAEAEHVTLGSTVVLTCNVSYLRQTTWLKHWPDRPPTLVLCAGLRDGQPVQGFRLSARHSAKLMDRSLALVIADVQQGDLGLYFCIASDGSCPAVEGGVLLQGAGPETGSSHFPFRHWFCVAVGSGFLAMVLTVCIIHCRVKKSSSTETCCCAS